MTQDEAARNEAAHGQGADGSPPPPPRDERPRPQYGEYAPEGWSWQPQAEPRTDAAASAPPPPAPPAPPAPQVAAARGNTVDRMVTIALLVLGAFGAWNSATSLQQLPAAIQTVYTQQGVGTYSPQEWLPTLALVGTVFMLALYAAVLGWSIARLRAGRVAFWVPIVGGVVALVSMIVLTAIVFFTDPTFLSFVEQQSAG
ncbi:MAG TPA: DUF6264 family protein [Agromyces sp.]